MRRLRVSAHRGRWPCSPHSRPERLRGRESYGVQELQSGPRQRVPRRPTRSATTARYTGHDEPSLLFYSGTAGSGNSNLYHLQLPSDPKVQPNQNGTGATWNFQLHPAFWLGMALCDNQSGARVHACSVHARQRREHLRRNEPGRRPTTSASIRAPRSSRSSSTRPGWVPWPPGVSCDATKWCAAMAIFSFNQDQNTGVLNNADCLDSVGVEPANFAFITTSGDAARAAEPARRDARDVHPERGDRPVHGLGRRGSTVDIHDAPAGLTTIDPRPDDTARRAR